MTIKDYSNQSTLTLKNLEIGSGMRPTEGFIHNDINQFDDIDIVADPWDIDLSTGSLDCILALGVMEHLTYSNFDLTLKNVHRMLSKDGIFLFDVPDIVVWARYLVESAEGKPVPFEQKHILSTIYGWQRWSGDEHKSGWTKDLLDDALHRAGFGEWEYGLENFLSRGFERRRMTRPGDAHFYLKVSR
jgi:predicted SAM-dependent methyltransferase